MSTETIELANRLQEAGLFATNRKKAIDVASGLFEATDAIAQVNGNENAVTRIISDELVLLGYPAAKAEALTKEIVNDVAAWRHCPRSAEATEFVDPDQPA
jgi:hypothetical protein